MNPPQRNVDIELAALSASVEDVRQLLWGEFKTTGFDFIKLLTDCVIFFKTYLSSEPVYH